jgi:hypothetical protein
MYGGATHLTSPLDTIIRSTSIRSVVLRIVGMLSSVTLH